MRFDWMNSPAKNPQQRDPASRAQALRHEVRERAGLFKRMGYPKAHAIHRCLGNIAWAYAQAGKPPVSAAEVRRIVDLVYGR